MASELNSDAQLNAIESWLSEAADSQRTGHLAWVRESLKEARGAAVRPAKRLEGGPKFAACMAFAEKLGAGPDNPTQISLLIEDVSALRQQVR